MHQYNHIQLSNSNSIQYNCPSSQPLTTLQGCDEMLEAMVGGALGIFAEGIFAE